MKLIKKCGAHIRYKNGRDVVAIYRCENDLPFTLEEMEKWIKEKEGDKILKIQCFEVPAGDG